MVVMDAAACEDIATLAASALSHNVAAFVAALEVELGRGGFSGARREVFAAGERVGPGFGRFVLDCLMELFNRPLKSLQMAANLLADVGPGLAPAQLGDGIGDDTGGGGSSCGGDAEAVATAAMTLVRERRELKLAVKLLQAWGFRDVTSLDAHTRETLAAAALQEAIAGCAPVAAACLVAFPGLLPPDEAWKVLEAVDNGKSDDVAERLAASSDRRLQVDMVRRRQQLGRLKAAARAVRALGLEDVFPDAEFDWRSQSLESALMHGSREPVVGLAFCEPRLRERCVAGLVQLGEALLAVELADAWALPVEQEVRVAAEEAKALARETFLCPPEAFRIHHVDSETAVLRMRETLLQSPRVGLDAEWSPAEGSPPCLLQLAAAEDAFLIDLFALGHSESLAHALEAVMRASSVTKVGFDAGADFGRIAKSYPALKICTQAEPLVDVHNAEVDLRVRRLGTSKKKAREGISLSGLAERYLGRPLEKALQMSDWSRRPLSPAQSLYAALDAWAPAQIHERQCNMVATAA